jgi:hypothetical protein
MNELFIFPGKLADKSIKNCKKLQSSTAPRKNFQYHIQLNLLYPFSICFFRMDGRMCEAILIDAKQ